MTVVTIVVYLNRSIVIRFDLDFTKNHISEFFSDYLNNLKSENSNNILNIISDVKTAYVEVEISWRNITKSPYVSRYETGINNQKIATINSEISTGNAFISYFDFTHSVFDNFYKNNNNLDLLAKNCIYPPYYYPLYLKLHGQYDALPKKWLNFHHSSFNEIQPNVNIDGSDIKLNFEDLFNAFLVAPKKLILEWLESMCYLGPLREIPSRYSSDNNPTRYSYQPDCNSKRWATGLAAWDFIYWIGQQKLYESDELIYKKLIYEIDDVMIGNPYGYQQSMTAYMIEYLDKEEYTDAFRDMNYWLSLRLNTGYEVEIELYREISSEIFGDYSKNDSDEIIKKILNQPEKIRIWLRDKSGRKLTPHEVGVGISQVLPVVIAAVGVKAPLVVIEQPELHIHPAVQVEISDLFISESNDRKFFLIETHSEHLLLRIMRRIRETAEEQAPNNAKIWPHEVAIYYVESENGSTQVNHIGLDQNGRFTNHWPRGFFAERMQEMLPSDIRERIEAKRQDKL